MLLIVAGGGPHQAACGAETLVVRHVETGNPPGRNEYQRALLDAALATTEADYGPYRLVAVDEMPQAREIQSLIDGRWHDVIWTMTDAAREAQMRAIRVPMLRGLLGHRICLVRRDNPLFDGTGRPDRGDLVIGQAVTWPDNRIIRSNGFRLEAGSDFQSTLRMLRAGRTNCFPRGLSEIDIEMAAYGSDDIVIDSQLSFLYFAPMYFFVARERTELAGRIEAGLRRLQQSGAFARLHAEYFDTPTLLEHHGMAHRHVFCLDNPDVEPGVVETMRPYLIAGPGTFVDECLDENAADQ